MTKTKHTIVINGRRFDAATGLALEEAQKAIVKPQPATVTPSPKSLVQPKIISDISPPAANKSHLALPKQGATVHKMRQPAPHAVTKVQKSATLKRTALKKPVSSRHPVAQKIHKKVQRSHRISRFAAHKPATETTHKQVEIDPELARQAGELHAAHAAHLRRSAETAKTPVISSRTIKEHLIKQQLAQAPHHIHPEVYQAGKLSPKARFMSVAATSFALILLGGYLTYINIPNLSIRVAAANAGIDASLPRYQPEGYRLHGPIAYSDGQVTVEYQRGESSQGFHILQKASDWDPQATLDNYVKPESRNKYQIHSTQGLTVYTYDNKAVWVNGGILHIINGNAPLSSTQVEQIAVSM